MHLAPASRLRCHGLFFIFLCYVIATYTDCPTVTGNLTIVRVGEWPTEIELMLHYKMTVFLCVISYLFLTLILTRTLLFCFIFYNKLLKPRLSKVVLSCKFTAPLTLLTSTFLDELQFLFSRLRFKV